jgi:hypothetical protein
VLAATSAVAVVGMANHPVGPESFKDYGRIFHGVMMVTAIVVFAALSRFTSRNGMERFAVWMGLVCLGFGTAANLIAGSVDGFVVPELAERGLEEQMWPLTWALNQTMAQGAIYLTGAAFVLWGIDWARRTTGAARMRGMAAALVGIIPPVCLALGIINMHAFGAFIAYSIQTIFSMLAAWELLRTKAT